MAQWKEAFKEQSTDGCYDHQTEFISKEIITKIIERIPDENTEGFAEALMNSGVSSPITVMAVMSVLKKELKEEWL